MKKHILIVDDEVPIRELLARYLDLAGYRVTSAGTAAEAEKTIADDPPQLIISDLQLEDSDGLVMIARLKARLPNTPVILLTGVLFDPEIIEVTLSKKVSSYLQKTTPLNKIVEEVRRFIGT
jgi:two-component system OmpR family response regulator